MREGIQGLESIVEDHRSDSLVLEKIKEELALRRSSKKNKLLTDRVDEYLTKLLPGYMEIEFPSCWLSENIFEEALIEGNFSTTGPILFVFPEDCKVMVNSAVRLLSFVNQLVAAGKQVGIKFVDGQSGAMSYLQRICFFKHLDKRVSVYPEVNRSRNIDSTTLYNSTKLKALINKYESENQPIPVKIGDKIYIITYFYFI